jgi:hypothetical protein
MTLRAPRLAKKAAASQWLLGSVSRISVTLVFSHSMIASADPKGQLMSFDLPAKTILAEIGLNSQEDAGKLMNGVSVAAYSLSNMLRDGTGTGVKFKGVRPENIQFYPDDSALPPQKSTPSVQELTVEGRPWFIIKFETGAKSAATVQGLLCATAAGLNCLQVPSETSANETRFRWIENAAVQTWKLGINGSPCTGGSDCSIVSSSWSRQLRLEGMRRGTGLSLSPNQVAIAHGNSVSLLDLDTRKTWGKIELPSADFNEPLNNAIGFGNGQVLLEWRKLRILMDFADDSCLVLNGTSLSKCKQGLASLIKSQSLFFENSSRAQLAGLYDFHGSEEPLSADAIALSSAGVVYGKSVYSAATRKRTELEGSPSRVMTSLDGKDLRLIAVIPSSQGDRLALRQVLNSTVAVSSSFPDANIALPQGFPEWTLLFSKQSSLFITSRGVFQLQNGGKLLPTSIALSHDAVSFLPESGGAFVRRGQNSACRWHHVRQHPTFENSFSESGASIACDGRVQFQASYGAVFATRVTPSDLQISATQFVP